MPFHDTGKQKHWQAKRTAPGIRCWSPTQLLIERLLAQRVESGRDPVFSSNYGRT